MSTAATSVEIHDHDRRVEIHCIRVKSRQEGASPLIMTHSGSVIELLKTFAHT
jgi:hypothetical protein